MKVYIFQKGPPPRYSGNSVGFVGDFDGTIKGINFSNCLFRTNEDNVSVLMTDNGGNFDGLMFTGCKFRRADRYAFHLPEMAPAIKDLKFTGCLFSDSNVQNDPDNAVILLKATVTNTSITCNTFGAERNDVAQILRTEPTNEEVIGLNDTFNSSQDF